jgi:hypothetical protein
VTEDQGPAFRLTNDAGRITALLDVGEKRDNAYRAIGRYTVQFSVLVANMRTILAEAIAPAGEDRQPRAELALSSLTAAPIADAFFGVCRSASQLDAAEQAIERRLRKHVAEECQRRNDIAHGDWLIAAWARPGVEVTPTLVRVKAGRVAQPFALEDYTAERIDEICTTVEALAAVVWEFGSVCLHQDAYDPRLGRPATHVRDALQLDGAGRVVFRGGATVNDAEKRGD